MSTYAFYLCRNEKAPCHCLLIEGWNIHNMSKSMKEEQEWKYELSAAGVVKKATSLLVVVICQVRQKQGRNFV